MRAQPEPSNSSSPRQRIQADPPAPTPGGNPTIANDANRSAPTSSSDRSAVTVTVAGGPPGESVSNTADTGDARTRTSGATTLDRFALVRRLGEGGMGDVFLARHPVTGTQVAVKQLKTDLVHDPRAVQRFLTEARHMYHLNHPHVLRIMEVWDPPAGPYYVMPYMTGGSLADRLKTGQPLDYVATLRVAREVASALAYAHGKGIIHRDLKPANVLLDRDGTSHLSDFGLVRAFDSNDEVADVRRSHCEGTVPYMSPAVAAGRAEDTRCDIYSFGAMLYELLTGSRPYDGATAQCVLDQILAGPPAPILKRNSHAPRGLVTIAEGCMARELRDRYADMADVVKDLEHVAAGRPPLGPHGKARAASRLPGLPARTRRRAGAAVVVGVVALVAAMAAWQLWPRAGDGSLAPASGPHATAPRSAPGDSVTEAVVAPTSPGVAANPVGADAAVGPALTPPVSTPTAAQQQRVVDLLPLVDLRRDVIAGAWTGGPEGIVSDNAESARLALPYEPPAEYDFSVEFTRLEGTDAVSQLLSHGTRRFEWIMGGWDEQVTGFQNLVEDGVPRGANTNQTGRHDVRPTNGRRHTSVVRVRRDGVEAFFDGKLVSRHKTDFADLQCSFFWGIGGKDLGLGSARGSTRFHAVRVTKVSGEGSPNSYTDDDRRLLHTLRGHGGPVTQVGFSGQGTRVRSSVGWFTNGDGSAAVSDVASGKRLCSTRTMELWALSPNGRRALLTTTEGPQLLDVETGSVLRSYPIGIVYGHGAFSPDGAVAVLGSPHGGIHVIDASSGSEVRRLDVKPGGGEIDSLDFSPDGRRLVSIAREARLVQCFDVSTGARLWERALPSNRWRVRFGPEGQHVVALLFDHPSPEQAVVLDGKDGEVVATLGDSDLIVDALLLPGGRHAVTASHSPTLGLKLWDLATGKPVTRFQEQTGRVNAWRCRQTVSGCWPLARMDLFACSTSVPAPRPRATAATTGRCCAWRSRRTASTSPPAAPTAPRASGSSISAPAQPAEPVQAHPDDGPAPEDGEDCQLNVPSGGL